jgi:AraC-like DNA-binding protein
MQSELLASCSVRVFWPFFDYFQERYGRGRELRDALPFADGSQRLSHEQTMGMLRGALRESGDPALGIHVAEVASHSAFDVLDYVTRTSTTLLEAFERTAHYIRTFIHDGVCFTVHQRDDGFAFALGFEPGLVVEPAAVEFTLATLLIRFRPLLPLEARPVRVHFMHRAPHDARAHQRVLGSFVSFSAPDSALILCREAALGKIPNGSESRPPAYVPSSSWPRDGARTLLFSQRVRELVTDEMRARVPSIELIGERLHMSPRTVQRRLHEEGTSFKGLADDVRRSLAESYVLERELSLSEVSFRLGFANVNAFHRAFRRWTGKTPALYRQTGARR